MKTVADDIREATREAHAAMKDWKREAKGLKDELRVLIAEARAEAERVETAAIALVEQEIRKVVKVELDALRVQMHDWSRGIYTKVIEEAHRTMLIAIHGDDKGEGVSVFEKLALLGRRIDLAQAAMDKGEDEEGRKVRLAVPNPVDDEAALRYRKMVAKNAPKGMSRAGRRRIARDAASYLAKNPEFVADWTEAPLDE